MTTSSSSIESADPTATPAGTEIVLDRDLDGAPKGSAAPALTIGYYAPDRSLVLYYDDVG